MLRDAVSPLVREMNLQPKFQGQDSRFVAVMKTKDTIFIAFPGTHTWDDMIADIRVLQPDVLSEVGVHSGFYARFEETGCIEEIKKLVTGSPGMQVCFTGHSLGAAVGCCGDFHAARISRPAGSRPTACAVRHLCTASGGRCSSGQLREDTQPARPFHGVH